MELTVTRSETIDGIVNLVLTGRLTKSTVGEVRQALEKTFTSQPLAVIVDVSRLDVSSREMLTVFPTVSAQQQAPAAAVILAAPTDELRAMLGAAPLGDVAVYDTIEQAHTAAIVGLGALRHSLTLPPAAASVGRARDMVTAVCLQWRLAEVGDAARVVISELVTNAVQHARTGMTVTIALAGSYLFLSVTDGSPELPRFSPDSQGLLLVDAFTTSWGTTATGQGKRVWAAVRVRPIEPR